MNAFQRDIISTELQKKFPQFKQYSRETSARSFLNMFCCRYLCYIYQYVPMMKLLMVYEICIFIVVVDVQ